MENLILNHHRFVQNQIEKSFDNDIEKANHGVYADNAENRKLGRVGQEYGHAKREEMPKGKRGKKAEKIKKKDDSNRKMSFDNAVDFLKEHANEYMNYQYGGLEDDDLNSKFDSASKYIKDFKQFDGSEEDDAEEWKEKMERRGYKVIDLGGESDTYAYAVMKKVKKAEDNEPLVTLDEIFER